MLMDLSAALALANTCAPSIAPETLLSIVSVESGFDPLVIGVNGARPRTVRSATKSDAARTASALIARGENIDLGLAQINVSNLAPMGLTVADAFDPCRNLTASARILSDGYGRARQAAGGEQAALRTALSFYNTGDRRRGLRNGYVARVASAAARLVPAIAVSQPAPSPTESPPANPEAQAQAQAQPAAWDVFARAQLRDSGFVFSSAPHSGASQ
jgi:type IV secretion system protein VirB1